MNITHLKYAVEVERTGSITKAAENLYMSQPNLSKAIRELENTLGIRLFKRSPVGVAPTEQGVQFFARAKELLSQIAEIEAMYAPSPVHMSFRAAVPRASYISYAFATFVASLSEAAPLDISFTETNNTDALSGIAEEDYDMAVIRFASDQEGFYARQIAERGLKSELIWEFRYRVLMGETNQFAREKKLWMTMLRDCIEIAHPDAAEQRAGARRRIYVRERGSQFDLLDRVPESYMLVSPVPAATLSRNGLIEKTCADAPVMRDVLVYASDHTPSVYEQRFIDEIKSVRDEISDT